MFLVGCLVCGFFFGGGGVRIKSYFFNKKHSISVEINHPRVLLADRLCTQEASLSPAIPERLSCVEKRLMYCLQRS